MSSYAIGQELPPISIEPDTLAVIVGNASTFDFFPGLIDPDFARSVGHKTVFINTLQQLNMMNRLALEAMPEGRIKSNEIAMRKPVYAGEVIGVRGKVSGTVPFAGSKLAGPGTEYQLDVEIHVGDEVRTKGKVSVVLP